MATTTIGQPMTGLAAQPTSPTLFAPFLGAQEKNQPYSIDFAKRLKQGEGITAAGAQITAYTSLDDPGTDVTAALLQGPLSISGTVCTATIGNQNAVPGTTYVLCIAATINSTPARIEEALIEGIVCPSTSPQEVVVNGLISYPTNAPQGGSTVTTGNGSTDDVYTFAALVQPQLQNNTNDVVYVAWGQGASRAATQGDYEVVGAQNAILQIPGWATWVALYADPAISVNGTTPGYALTGTS